MIKESLVIQISHAYGVMSESRLRERSAEKPFQVEAGGSRGGERGGEGRLSSQWSHFALIQFCIVFYSEVVCFLSENWPLFVYLLFVFARMQLLGCKQTTICKPAQFKQPTQRHVFSLMLSAQHQPASRGHSSQKAPITFPSRRLR